MFHKYKVLTFFIVGRNPKSKNNTNVVKQFPLGRLKKWGTGKMSCRKSLESPCLKRQKIN